MEQRIEDIISSVTSNPELFEKISSTLKENDGDISKSLGDVVSLISENKKSDENEASTNHEENEAYEKSSVEENNENEEKEAFNGKPFFDLFSSLSGKDGGIIASIGRSLNKCAPLLIALKPYLSHSRCELIDTMIKISKLSSIVNLAR